MIKKKSFVSWVLALILVIPFMFCLTACGETGDSDQQVEQDTGTGTGAGDDVGTGDDTGTGTGIQTQSELNEEAYIALKSAVLADLNYSGTRTIISENIEEIESRIFDANDQEFLVEGNFPNVDFKGIKAILTYNDSTNETYIKTYNMAKGLNGYLVSSEPKDIKVSRPEGDKYAFYHLERLGNANYINNAEKGCWVDESYARYLFGDQADEWDMGGDIATEYSTFAELAIEFPGLIANEMFGLELFTLPTFSGKATKQDDAYRLEIKMVFYAEWMEVSAQINYTTSYEYILEYTAEGINSVATNYTQTVTCGFSGEKIVDKSNNTCLVTYSKTFDESQTLTNDEEDITKHIVSMENMNVRVGLTVDGLSLYYNESVPYGTDISTVLEDPNFTGKLGNSTVTKWYLDRQKTIEFTGDKVPCEDVFHLYADSIPKDGYALIVLNVTAKLEDRDLYNVKRIIVAETDNYEINLKIAAGDWWSNNSYVGEDWTSIKLDGVEITASNNIVELEEKTTYKLDLVYVEED